MRIKEYNSTTKIAFGLFEGKTLSEIVDIKPDYIEWCIIHLDHFYTSEETIENLSEINPGFSLSNRALEILEEKSKKIRVEDDYDEQPSYGKYRGSYAQDCEGLSDDFIDSVLDGFEDAYWNID